MELSEEAKQARKEYRREWRAKNKDKVAESNRRYWEKKSQMIPDTPAATDDDETED